MVTTDGIVVDIPPERLALWKHSILATVRQDPKHVHLDDLDIITVRERIAGPDGPERPSPLARIYNEARDRGHVVFCDAPNVGPWPEPYCLLPTYRVMNVCIIDMPCWDPTTR